MTAHFRYLQLVPQGTARGSRITVSRYTQREFARQCEIDGAEPRAVHGGSAIRYPVRTHAYDLPCIALITFLQVKESMRAAI